MVKRLNDKIPLTPVMGRRYAIVTKPTVEGIDIDGLSQRLQQLYVDLLNTKLKTALILAQMKCNQKDLESREQTKKRAFAICSFIREQLLKVPLDTQNRQWVDEKLKEIERLLEVKPMTQDAV
jgi:hypothetical protein